MTTSLEIGMLVQHASLGLGKIVAVEPKAVHVVFASQDARFATKLRLPMALAFLSPSKDSNARLSALSGFDLDDETGRYGRTSAWLSHADAVARFTQAYPLAFSDPAYVAAEKGRGDRACRWRRAHLAFADAFGEGRGEALLAHYETWGDRSLRFLAQEQRVAPMRRVADAGRAVHHEWVDHVFAPWLARKRGAVRARLRARLIAVTDVYVWKIVRRDLGLDPRAVEMTLRELVAAVVA